MGAEFFKFIVDFFFYHACLCQMLGAFQLSVQQRNLPYEFASEAERNPCFEIYSLIHMHVNDKLNNIHAHEEKQRNQNNCFETLEESTPHGF